MAGRRADGQTGRRLIINADDYGFAPGVNRGIVEAHLAGTLPSTSMMVNTPAFHEAAALARDVVPTLDIGLHFNLLSGSPLTEVPTLIDARTRQFLTLAELTRRAVLGRISAADVRRECDAQLAALARVGISPSHVDSHRHAHALPGVLAPMVASARAAGVRVVRRPLDRLTPDPVANVKRLVLRGSWQVASRALGAEDRVLVQRAPHFRGIDLQGAPDVEQRLLALIDDLPAGTTELMLHPGYDDAILAAQDPYRLEREREVAALKSPSLISRLACGDVKLVSFLKLQ